MYRVLNDMSPDYLKKGVIRVNEIHGHFTRSSRYSLYRPIICKGNHSQTTFLNTSICCWNSLPQSVQCSSSICVFKKNVKSYLRLEQTNNKK